MVARATRHRDCRLRGDPGRGTDNSSYYRQRCHLQLPGMAVDHVPDGNRDDGPMRIQRPVDQRKPSSDIVRAQGTPVAIPRKELGFACKGMCLIQCPSWCLLILGLVRGIRGIDKGNGAKVSGAASSNALDSNLLSHVSVRGFCIW